MNDRVCIIGLGYVGLTLAVALADVGCYVRGVEIREDWFEKIRRSEPPFHEPGLKEALERSARNGRLTVHATLPGPEDVDVYVITVGTPLDAEGRVDMTGVERVAASLTFAVKHDLARYPEIGGPLVILRSTVKIGTTRRLAEGALKGAHVAFCPERTLEGVALSELRTLPQVIGGMTPEATDRAAALFSRLTPTILKMSSPEAAELLKLTSNTWRDVGFAYANEIARIGDSLGIDAREVIEKGAFGYPRFRMPMPGPVGGPCLTKDGWLLAEGDCGWIAAPPVLTRSARLTNQRVGYEVAWRVAGLRQGLSVERIGLIGFAFKGVPPTDDVRGSPAGPIVAELRSEFPDAQFVGWDRYVPADVVESFGVRYGTPLGPCDVIVIMNNAPLEESSVLRLAEQMRKPGLIYDCWGQFAGKTVEWPEGVRYVWLGGGFR